MYNYFVFNTSLPFNIFKARNLKNSWVLKTRCLTVACFTVKKSDQEKLKRGRKMMERKLSSYAYDFKVFIVTS